MTVEMPRPVVIAKIPAAGLVTMVHATPEECAAIALRMDIPAILSLTCAFQLTREDDGVSIAAHGSLTALVTRTCIVSAEDFETPVTETFDIRFVPAGQERDDLDPDALDEVPYAAGAIDLGEAATEQLGLALDPYPRIPDAALPDTGEDADFGPFGALAPLKKPG